MHRSITTALATSAALALTAFGAAAPASATQKLTKEVGEWVSVDESYTFPKGTACKHEVTVKEEAQFRDILYKDKSGKVVKVYSEFQDWSNVTFSATVKKHRKAKTRSIRLNEGGDAWVYNLKGDFDRVKVEAEGTNWGQGAGVYGIVWSKGDISYVVTDANDPEKSRIVQLDLSEAKKVIQVCYRIGSEPVWGENLLPPEQP